MQLKNTISGTKISNQQKTEKLTSNKTFQSTITQRSNQNISLYCHNSPFSTPCQIAIRNDCKTDPRCAKKLRHWSKWQFAQRISDARRGVVCRPASKKSSKLCEIVCSNNALRLKKCIAVLPIY